MTFRCASPHSGALHEAGDHDQGGGSSAFSFLKTVQAVLHTYFENIQKMSQLVAELAAKVSFKSR